MVRTGALVLIVLTGVLALAGAAAAAPSLVLKPTTGFPGFTLTVLPALDQPGQCQLELDGAAQLSPAACGRDPAPFSLTAPTDPGVHTVTLCAPDCGGQSIRVNKTFTVLDPLPTDTSPLGVVVPPPVSQPGSVATPSETRNTTPVGTPSSVPAKPVAAGSRVPPSLVATGVGLLVLLALGGTLLLRRRRPVPHHAGAPGHAVVVSTSGRRRAVRAAPRAARTRAGRRDIAPFASRLVAARAAPAGVHVVSDPLDLSLGALVLGGGDPNGRLTATLNAAPTVEQRRREPFWHVAGDLLLSQVRQAAEDLLGATPLELLTSGWRMQTDLVAAARRTVRPAGGAETVDVDRDTLEIADSVDVEVTVDGTAVTRVPVAVVVVLHIGSLRAQVRDGRLCQVAWGDAELGAELRLDDRPVAVSPRVRLLRGATRAFDPGIDLV